MTAVNCLHKHDKAPGGAGASIVYSVVTVALPSATRCQYDLLSLRDQFLAEINGKLVTTEVWRQREGIPDDIKKPMQPIPEQTQPKP
jgi:hypothetical protein